MFDNKTLKEQSAQETLFPRLKCVCVCVCVCAPEQRRSALQNGQANYSLSFRRVQTIKYTQYVKMIGYESIHLNTIYVLSGPEQLGENPMCVNILS